MKYILSVLIILIFCSAAHAQSIRASGATTFCAGGSATLTVDPATGITGYQWLNGNTVVGANASYIANASGSYSVKVKRGPLPDTTIGPIGISVNALPIVSVNSASICTGLSATLTATGANTYSWSPATGLSPATGSIVNASPAATTTYTITGTNTLTGCSNTATSTVTVNTYPVANFTFVQPGQCSNVPVSFTNTSTGGNTYQWDFGDINSGADNSSASPNPVHTFIGTPGNSAQNFNVVQTVTNAGCSITKTVNITTTQIADGTLGGTGKVTYNGQTYFTTCGAGSGDFTFTNQSLTAGSNQNYQIVWGDGSPDFTATTFSSTPHTYAVGSHPILFIVKGSNGCVDTTKYFAFVGTNPAVGLNNPGNTLACSGESLTFPITGVSTNAPGTVYTVTFNDGTPPITYIHPNIPASITHIFNTTSCGTTSSNGTNTYANSFSANIVAQNPCNSSAATVVPIYISKKPKASFTIAPNDTVCANTTVTLTNTSESNFVSNGSCLNGNSIWSVTPATGWTRTSGIFGNDFGLTDPSVWQNGSDVLLINFTIPGVYTIKIKTGNNNCGVDSISQTICVTSPPMPSFTLNSASGCIPFNVTATNTTTSLNSCSAPKYSWSVNYTPAFCGTSSSWDFAPGSAATSTNPSFIFNAPGTYEIFLEAINECGPFQSSQTINVKSPPAVTITPPSYPCGPVTITPVANVISCSSNALTYAWSFDGGSPESSTSADPGPVSFSGVGTHTITLVVTSECGATTATESVTVTAAPNVVVPANQVKCGGASTGPLNFSSTVGTPAYKWTNDNPAIGLPANGTGNIAAFIPVNDGATPQIATITVTPFVNTQCSGAPVSFTITVNPRPAAPVAVTQVVVCLNAAAAPLSASATGLNTLTWYNNSALTNGSATAPTPATSNQGTTLYYVTQTNSFTCESAPTEIAINVNPSVAGNTIGAAQNICANTVPAPLNTINVVSGGSGSYAFTWQSSTDNGATWANIPGAINESYAPPALSDTTEYRRLINSGPCPDTSNIITITVQGALANFDISPSQIICEGSIPALLAGQLPTGGGGAYTYIWESSADNISWSSIGVTTADYQPGALSQTTYFRRRIAASQCAAISSVVTLNVNPRPDATIATTDTSVCEYDAAAIVFNATAGTAPFKIELKVTKPDGTSAIILQTVNNNGSAKFNILPANSVPGIYTIVLNKISDGKTCERTGDISTVSITIKPKPTLVASPAPAICSGTNTGPIIVSGAESYLWTPSAGLSSTTDSSVIANPTNTTIYTITGTLNNCINSVNLTVTVTPGATIAETGAAQVLCNIASATLEGNTAAIGTGSWRQLAGAAATLTDALQNATTVTGLIAGQRYIFTWTITGLAPCPATSANDTIDVLTSILNTVKNDTVICSAQPVLLQTQLLSGGSTNSLPAQYTYQWEDSIAGQSNWQSIAGATEETLSVSPTVSTCYRRKVKSNNSCESISNAVCIKVNPTIGNNIISSTQQVCVNVIPGNLTGTLPAGGDNNYIYQWQTSIDSINWMDVSSDINYQPPTYTIAGIYSFRRNVSSGNCTSASNIISITVKPDAKALFIANPSTSCAPFDLAKAINVTALPDSNGLYEWYADGVLSGSNATGAFPGYIIQNAADTVLIKLKTSSQFGCKPDSIQQQFVTVITAVARFTKDSSFGCGPLPVNFTNTSNLINGIQFFWDFGNGDTSTLAQPPRVNFISSPFFSDTTYQVTLKAYNGCDTTVWRDSVKVRANPKARFGVDTTFGCSPFSVKINNTSLGGPNTYYWDFGNGVKDTTFNTGSFDQTYNIGNAVDTFTIRLIAENECRRDTQSIDIRIAPNPIRPLINVNSSELFGCTPHIVSFNNNTSGATRFTWNFGDNTPPIVTNNNQGNVVHTYDNAGVFTVSIDITNGCSDTVVFRQVTVYPRPVAAFITNAAVFCAGDTVRVINASKDATNYSWFWGDGSPGTENDTAHVFNISGNYNIILRAERTNDAGLVCMDTLVRPVTVLAKPVVTVQSNINTINCAPFTLNVTAPGIINENVNWYFYDSTVTPQIISSNNISAQYTFNRPGTYYVKLVATNERGCNDSTVIYFTVRGKAVASFTPLNLTVCTRDTTVSYINTSTYNGTDPVSYQWLVDNVLISTSANFTHQYSVLPAALLPKTFTTHLIASNTVGCSDTAVATLQLNPAAKAQFSISIPGECVPFKPVIVNASQYTTSYQWLLNGVPAGNSEVPDIFVSQSSTPYTLTLVAGNIYGCKPDTFAITFTSKSRPAATFALSDTLGCNGSLSVLTNNKTTGPNLDSYTYIWNWGDGTTNNFTTNASHLYTTTGQYLVTMVAGDGTCRDTTEQVVSVSVKPVVDFSVDQTRTCGTAKVQFINLSDNVTNYAWSFGDGTISTVVNPGKSYPPRQAPYTVKLVGSNNFGCRDSVVKPNLILAVIPPAADFLISPSAVITVPDYTFGFNNLTINSANYKYLWSLGDGTFASTRDVTHKYADTGSYAVRLIVLDTVTNCPDTTIRIARIGGFPGYLYVPNAFYPNSIRNEFKTFKPLGKGLASYQLQIFDSWGKLMFQTTVLDIAGSPSVGWDGTYNGVPVAQDTYAWKIKATFKNNKIWDGMIYSNIPGKTKGVTFGTLTLFR